jgi:hypothetical protein
MWQQAKTEITFVQQKVKAALGGKEPTIKTFGTSSSALKVKLDGCWKEKCC